MGGGGNVMVTVETPAENQVMEVTYDGQEILQAAPTPAEHLTRQAAKVDFDAAEVMDDEDDEDEDGEDDATADAAENAEEEDGDDEPATNTTRAAQESKSMTQQWPWESVRNHLRDALTEMSVLSDVIAVSTKECGKDPATGAPRRYMVLDGPVQHEKPEPRPYVSLLAKKRSLEAPARILLAGAEHLRGMQSDNAAYKHNQEFHVELLRLRQNWRLKKVSNTILGDLSYRTTGSTFKHSGVFEVVKADDPTLKKSESSSSTSADDQSHSSATTSALRVNVPSELEDIAYIHVRIQKEADQLMSLDLTNLASSNPRGGGGGGAGGGGGGDGSQPPPPEMHWQNKLEAAQNVLFCKELFAQLAREAIALQDPIPHMVVGNQITSSLFPDIQLIVSLCRSSSGGSGASTSSSYPGAPAAAASSSTGAERKGSGGAGASSGGPGGQGEGGMGAQGLPPQSQRDHSHVLEHSLHQLLRLQHSRNINPDHRALSSAPAGVTKRRRLAGPRAADRRSLLHLASAPTILEQVIAQARHVVLRLRTMFVLVRQAGQLKL